MLITGCILVGTGTGIAVWSRGMSRRGLRGVEGAAVVIGVLRGRMCIVERGLLGEEGQALMGGLIGRSGDLIHVFSGLKTRFIVEDSLMMKRKMWERGE